MIESILAVDEEKCKKILVETCLRRSETGEDMFRKPLIILRLIQLSNNNVDGGAMIINYLRKKQMEL